MAPFFPAHCHRVPEGGLLILKVPFATSPIPGQLAILGQTASHLGEKEEPDDSGSATTLHWEGPQRPQPPHHHQNKHKERVPRI